MFGGFLDMKRIRHSSTFRLAEKIIEHGTKSINIDLKKSVLMAAMQLILVKYRVLDSLIKTS